MTVFGLLLAAGRGRRFDPSGQHSKLEALIEGRPVAVHACLSLLGGSDRVFAVCRADQQALASRLASLGAEVVTLAPGGRGEGMGESLAAGARAIVAAGADPLTDWVLVLPGDMPWVDPATIAAIAAANQASPIVVPVRVANAAEAAEAVEAADIAEAADAVDAAGAAGTAAAVDTGRHQGRRDRDNNEATVGRIDSDPGGTGCYDDREGHPVRFAASLLPELAMLSGDKGGRVLFRRHPVLRLAVADSGVLRDVDRPGDLARPGP